VKFKDTFIAVFAAGLLATLAYVWLSGTGVERAPQVDLTLLDGGSLDPAARSEGPTLVTFWATTCVGCRKEIPHLIELYHDYQPRGFEIVAIAMSYDPPNQVYEFRKRAQLPYRVALDLDGSAARAFDEVRLTPTTFVIDRRGRIVFKKVGEFDVEQMRTRIEGLLHSPA